MPVGDAFCFFWALELLTRKFLNAVDGVIAEQGEPSFPSKVEAILYVSPLTCAAQYNKKKSTREMEIRMTKNNGTIIQF